MCSSLCLFQFSLGEDQRCGVKREGDYFPILSHFQGPWFSFLSLSAPNKTASLS